MIGLVTIGANHSPVELSAKWRAGSSVRKQPSEPGQDVDEIKRHQREIERTYVGSPRYTLEVDAKYYSRQLNEALATVGLVS